MKRVIFQKYRYLSDGYNLLTSFRAVVRIPYDSTAKNRYSFDEPRNLSCAREYGFSADLHNEEVTVKSQKAALLILCAATSTLNS